LGEVIHAGLGADSVYLWTLPMFHCNGWCFPWAVTAVAARHVTLRAVDPELAWELMDSEGVTHYNGAPTVQLMILNHPRAHRLERPVTAMVAAAPPSPTLFARMSELNFRIVHVYGLTETYGPITVCPEQQTWRELPLEQRARYLARQGQAYISADLVRVVDKQMNDVAQDGQTMGEVIMRGNNVMSGYYQDQAATSKAFAGGWFHSGDLAVWHPDGTIELRDRGKDIIISGGENISSIEVEQTIAAHPAVLECAVIGVPHPHWGERPKAFVTLNDGATATPQQIIAFCRERLAHYKCPDTIEFGPLPKTSTGKIQKFVLRDREGQTTTNGSALRRAQNFRRDGCPHVQLGACRCAGNAAAQGRCPAYDRPGRGGPGLRCACRLTPDCPRVKRGSGNRAIELDEECAMHTGPSLSSSGQVQVGSVVALWRYPVKSMMGEEFNACEVTGRGLLGDRRFAVVDRATGKVGGAKNPRKWGNFFDFRAAYAEPPRTGARISRSGSHFPMGPR
jgi:AMP-binding enzyme/AMP-binding enzyme C-terminal domain/MOSC N-terminal beta barrel domain